MIEHLSYEHLSVTGLFESGLPIYDIQLALIHGYDLSSFGIEVLARLMSEERFYEALEIPAPQTSAEQKQIDQILIKYAQTLKLLQDTGTAKRIPWAQIWPKIEAKYPGLSQVDYDFQRDSLDEPVDSERGWGEM